MEVRLDPCRTNRMPPVMVHMLTGLSQGDSGDPTTAASIRRFLGLKMPLPADLHNVVHQLLIHGQIVDPKNSLDTLMASWT